MPRASVKPPEADVSAPSAMAGFSRWILRHKGAVALAWLLATAIAFASLSPAVASLSNQFSLPGREGYETNQEILRTYGTGLATPIVAVVTLPAGTTVDSPGVDGQLRQAFDGLAAAVPNARSASYVSTGDRAFVSADGRTTFALVHFRGTPGFDAGGAALAAAREALTGVQVAGAPVRLTGIDALRAGTDEGEGAGVLTEVILGGAGALIVLLLVFGSLLSLVPLLMAAVAIPVTFLMVWGLTTITDISAIIQFFIALVGLGVAIDFALLIVMRWREERETGVDNETAVLRAMDTAGRSVIFSGTTVAISLLALIALPVPFLRGLGLGGMLIPLASVAVAVTLLPVVLATVGPRLDRRRFRRMRASRLWPAWSRLIVRRRWLASALTVGVLVLLIIPALGIRPGDPEAAALAKGGEAHDARVALVGSGIGDGVLNPFETLVSGTDPATVASRMGEIEGVRAAVAPDDPTWRQGDTALIDVLATADASSPAGQRVLDRVRDVADASPGRVQVGGFAAENADFVDAIYGSFPLMLGIIILLTFVLLTRALRSVVLAAKAVVFNVLSLGAVYGVLVLVWQDGFGSEAVWGIEATGSITAWVPLVVFAFLFGLSMDYEVFILSRMREEYDLTGSTDEAVVRGITHTGPLVTSAGLILFLAFVALGASPETDIKILATGLGVGILLDATIVRALLLPALVSAMGHWNWYLPDGMRRILRVPAPALSQSSTS